MTILSNNKYILFILFVLFIITFNTKPASSQYQSKDLVFTNHDCDNLILNLNQELKKINKDIDITQQLQSLLLNAIQQSILSYYQTNNLSGLSDKEGEYLAGQIIDCIKYRLSNLKNEEKESEINTFNSEENINLLLELLFLFNSDYSETSHNNSNTYNTPDHSKNIKDEYVFICTSGKPDGCCKSVVVTSKSKPESSGCCPRTDGRGCTSGHSWRNCGKTGNRNYQCSACGITVRTASQPENSCCPIRDCGFMHSWREIK
jgi:hypothetical protein